MRSAGAWSLRWDGSGDGLGPAVNVNALQLLEDGAFLFSTDAPFDSRGTVYEARDIVRYDGGNFSPTLNVREAGRASTLVSLASVSNGSGTPPAIQLSKRL